MVWPRATLALVVGVLAAASAGEKEGREACDPETQVCLLEVEVFDSRADCESELAGAVLAVLATEGRATFGQWEGLQYRAFAACPPRVEDNDDSVTLDLCHKGGVLGIDRCHSFTGAAGACMVAENTTRAVRTSGFTCADAGRCKAGDERCATTDLSDSMAQCESGAFDNTGVGLLVDGRCYARGHGDYMRATCAAGDRTGYRFDTGCNEDCTVCSQRQEGPAGFCAALTGSTRALRLPGTPCNELPGEVPPLVALAEACSPASDRACVGAGLFTSAEDCHAGLNGQFVAFPQTPDNKPYVAINDKPYMASAQCNGDGVVTQLCPRDEDSGCYRFSGRAGFCVASGDLTIRITNVDCRDVTPATRVPTASPAVTTTATAAPSGTDSSAAPTTEMSPADIGNNSDGGGGVDDDDDDNAAVLMSVQMSSVVASLAVVGAAFD